MSIYESSTYCADLKQAIKNSIGLEILKGKSVLITGATGTIGSFLADMLIEYNKTGAGIVIYVAGRSIKRLKERFECANTSYINYVEHDVMKKINFEFTVDYIIHAGGNAHPVAFNSDPVGTIVGNILGTYNLLEYSKNNGVKRFCYVSSGEVYGQGDVSLEAFDENYSGYLDQMSPRSCYPTSKRTAETLCASFSKQYGLETVIVRPSHTYGPGITGSDSRANVQFIRNVLNGDDIVLKSAGSQLRSYNYIADCASAIYTVLIKGNSGEAYNIANPNVRITIAELAQIIAICAGRKVVFENPTALDIANRTPIAKQVLDTEKIEKLGWKSVYSAEMGVKHTLDILQGN